jgi:multisubunit Na+/H+ antiporter MnhF subunit
LTDSAFTYGCLVALLLGGFLPAVLIASRGEPGERLVGLQLATSVAVAGLVLFSQLPQGQSYELIAPLVLVLLSFAGTLVFTRLLGHSRDSGGGS